MDRDLDARAAAIAALACPVCGGGLEAGETGLACPAGHSFDLARSGYVNLTAGRRPRRAGDTAAMVRARERFLAAGHLDPVADAVAARCAGVEPRTGAVVELGAGTGRYLERAALERERRHGRPVAALGFDLSKPATAAAARAHPARLFAIADVAERVPVRTAAVDVALSVFAPRPAGELARIVRPGGGLVVAAATERHFGALRDRFGLLGVRPGKLDELRRRLSSEFALTDAEVVEYPVTLTADEVRAAIAMGPSARHGASADGLRGEVADVVSVTVAAFERRAGG